MPAKVKFFIKTLVERYEGTKNRLKKEKEKLNNSLIPENIARIEQINHEIRALNEQIKEAKKKIDVANILVRFSNGKKFDIIAPSQKQINPTYWNNETGMVRQRAEFTDKGDFQKDLNKLSGDIIAEFDNSSDKSKTAINKEWLERVIDKSLHPEKYDEEKQQMTLFNFIQKFIDNSTKRTNPETGQPIKYRMRREYQITFNYLKKYAEEFGEPDFIDIDVEFYNNLLEFLRNQKVIIRDKDGNIVKEKYLATNTVGKKISVLKIFLNSATEQGINKYMKYKSRKFKSPSEDADNIFLTKEELNEFYQHDLSEHPYFERVRDLFIVASWTGVRFSDIKQIKPERINSDNILTIKQNKTGKTAKIPINPIVWAIINKYDGNLPDVISNQKFNDYLKKAAKLAEIDSIFVKTVHENGMRIEKEFPKHEIISSHAARRSFCTNAFKDGIPTLHIMSISGHRTEKAFLKYIKVDGEEHAKKVLQMWQSNGNFLNIAK